MNKGKQFGYQEVTELEKDEKVSFMLTSKAPFEQETKLHFIFKQLDTESTEATLV